MSFLRPEAKAALWQRRELLSGLAVTAFGVWLVVTGLGFLRVIGSVVTLSGAALAFAGLQRARFRQGGGGPGVVQIDERQVLYYGPLTGGSVSLDSLTRVELSGTGVAQHWILIEPGAPALSIPTKAEGADMLFDAFATLRGMNIDAMLAALSKPDKHPVVIWQKDIERLH